MILCVAKIYRAHSQSRCVMLLQIDKRRSSMLPLPPFPALVPTLPGRPTTGLAGGTRHPTRPPMA